MISHSSNKTGGGEDDFQKLLEYFFHNDFMIYSVFPEGYRAEYYKSLSFRYLVLPDNIFPFNSFDLRKYLMFIYFTIKKIIILLPFLNLVKKKIDVCFVNSSACLSEILALNILGIPFILSIKEIIFPVIIRNLIYSFYNLSVINVIVISEYLKNIVSRNFEYSKVKLIHSSINEKEANAIKYSKLQKSYDKFVILNIGVITPSKNQILLLKSLSKINSDNKIVINFVGRVEDNSYYEKLKLFSSKLNNKNIEINFIGEVNKEKVLKMEYTSDLVVMTSRYEGMSIVLAEALYFEKPIISTKTGVAMEVIKDNYNGFLIDCEDFEKLAEIIDSLISDITLRKIISSRQLEIYNKCFNSEFYLYEHERILFEI